MRVFKVLPVVAICSIIAAAGGIRSAAAAEQSEMRVVFVTPDAASAADIYVDAVPTLSHVTYKTVSSYLALTPGSHTLAVRPAGSDPSSTPWTEMTQVFSANAYYTVAVAGRFGQLQAVAFQDRFPGPSNGQAEARFIHMAPDVPAVDVVVQGGPVLFSNISFLQASDYKAVPAGSYNLELHATGTSQVLFTASNVVVAGGTINSEAGVGGVGSPVELLQIPDAGSAAMAPVGGANTGAGGLAGRQPAPVAPVAAGLLAAAALVVVATGIRRSRGEAR